jgi:predicted phosphodiesterase
VAAPSATPAPRDTVRRRLSWGAVGRVALVVLVASVGAGVGLAALGGRSDQLGPLQVHTLVAPSLTGETVVDIPPLGTVSLDTHDAPFALRVRVDAVDLSAAGDLLNDPAGVEAIRGEAQGLVARSLVRSGSAALLGAVLAVLLVYRRRQLALRTLAVSSALLVVVVLGAVVTRHADALARPRYTGALVYAPQLVGQVDVSVGNLRLYGEQLARLVGNVSKLSAALTSLPVYEPDPGTLRVLHVSDIHLNPSVWPIMRTIIDEYHVDLVVDTGDIADHGTAAESPLLAGIATLGVPYVYIGGNHDSALTERAVDRLPDTTVLHGNLVTVDGLRILGDRDPRFTPDRSTTPDSAAVTAEGEQLAATARSLSQPPDVVLVHDPTAAPPLTGVTPLVLAGHTHQRREEDLGDGTTLLVQGSSGGAGLRALESESPTPLTFTVLYFDRTTHELVARDEITLGGVGLSSAEVDRITLPP